jgi:tetratricopeptide (TPR) repeat protein
MHALAALGFTYKGINVEDSMGWIEEALEIAVEIGDRGGEVTALNRLALCHGNLAQLDRGLELSRRALAVAREAGDDALVALALDAMKLNLLEIGDLDELARTCEELQGILAARGDLQVLAFALMEGAYVHIARAEWEAASAQLEEAMALSRRIGDRLARPLMLEAVCYLSRARGDPGRALAAGREALALSEDRPFWKAWASATLGWTLLDLFAVEEAARVLEQGVESAGLAGALDQQIRCTSHLARARQAQGRAPEARELAARGEQLLAESSVPEGESFLLAADAVLSLARVRLADEEVDRARALVVPLREPAGRHGWIEVVGVASLLLARCELATGDLERAGELASGALDAAGSRLPGVAWEAHALAAELALEAGDVESADRHRAQARSTVERLAAGIGDEKIRRTFVEGALGEPAGAVGTG